MIYNHKIAKHTNADDSDEAVFSDQAIFNEHENPAYMLNEVENPAADESQESHSPSPSFCLCDYHGIVLLVGHRFTSIQRHAVVLELLRLREVLQQ